MVRVDCPSCEGRGRLEDRRCERCDGTGFVVKPSGVPIEPRGLEGREDANADLKRLDRESHVPVEQKPGQDA
jgi:RecJ-like exonuclease